VLRNLLVLLFFGLPLALICLLAVGSGILHVYDVPTHAMEPTLHQGERLAEVPLLRKGNLPRGSIVAFHLPYDQALNGVGRVVGRPGDHIRVAAGHLILNGKQVYEPYLRTTSADNGLDFPSNPDMLFDNPEIRRLQSFMYGELVVNDAVTVPDGYYFVMGDNRGHSVDSRIYGPVSQNAVFARPVFVYSLSGSNRGLRFFGFGDVAVKP
jgi:signal peptidase I